MFRRMYVSPEIPRLHLWCGLYCQHGSGFGCFRPGGGTQRRGHCYSALFGKEEEGYQRAQYEYCKVMEISTEREVSYSDLDLSNPGDAAKLQQRISEAAKEACAQLDKEYSPITYAPVSDSRSCARNATNEAMAMAKEIIDASKKTG